MTLKMFTVVLKGAGDVEISVVAERWEKKNGKYIFYINNVATVSFLISEVKEVK